MVSDNQILGLINKYLFKMNIVDKRKVLKRVINEEECDKIYQEASFKQKQEMAKIATNDACETILLRFLAKQYGYTNIKDKTIEKIRQDPQKHKLKDTIDHYVSLQEEDMTEEEMSEEPEEQNTQDTLSDLTFEDTNSQHSEFSENNTEDYQEDTSVVEDGDDNDEDTENEEEMVKKNNKSNEEDNDEYDLMLEPEDNDEASLSLIESDDDLPLDEDI